VNLCKSLVGRRDLADPRPLKVYVVCWGRPAVREYGHPDRARTPHGTRRRRAQFIWSLRPWRREPGSTKIPLWGTGGVFTSADEGRAEAVGYLDWLWIGTHPVHHWGRGEDHLGENWYPILPHGATPQATLCLGSLGHGSRNFNDLANAAGKLEDFCFSEFNSTSTTLVESNLPCDALAGWLADL